MDRNELESIVNAVVQALEEKGIIKKDTLPPAKAPPLQSQQKVGQDTSSNPAKWGGVTVGTAGKVFTSPLVNWNRDAKAVEQSCGESNGAKVPGTGDSSLKEFDRSAPDDKEHNPLDILTPQDLSDIGVDRIGVCHPTEKCSLIACMIDHTLLKPNATQEEIGKLCEEARKFCFASVCINPAYVPLSARLLKGSGVRVCTVIGFPLGSTTPTVKAIEARDAMANGADEIDMVINVGALKSGNDALVFDDIKAVRDATRGKVLKVIIETAYLTNEEKVRACKLSKDAGADFVKTSTGFGPGGATAEDVALMRETVGKSMGVKASGGIRNADVAQAMIKAGATRLGASASINIVTGRKDEKKGY